MYDCGYGLSSSPPSVPMTCREWPASESLKKRAVLALSRRQRCTCPGRIGSTGFTCPFTMMVEPSLPCMYSMLLEYGAGLPPLIVMSLSTITCVSKPLRAVSGPGSLAGSSTISVPCSPPQTCSAVRPWMCGWYQHSVPLGCSEVS